MTKKKTTDDKIDDLALAVGRGFNEVREQMDLNFKQVHGRLTGIEEQLERGRDSDDDILPLHREGIFVRAEVKNDHGQAFRPQAETGVL